MTMMGRRLSVGLLASVVLLLVVSRACDAFQIRPVSHATPTTPVVLPQRVAPLSMSSSEDPTTVTSGRKEIGYDDASGRFYETGIETMEGCNPEEEFCIPDKSTGELIRLTLEEKERIFLDALQSYYTSGRQLLSDGEFDLLKEDLAWSGSDMVLMNRKEELYLTAMQDYLKGTPTMPDKDFDTLKKDLMAEGSKFAVQTEPVCYIDTGVCKVTLQEDKFRSNLLYLPAALILATLWLGLGFELLAPFVRLNPLFLLLLGSPLIYIGSRFITEDLVFQNKFIVFGPCPNCEAENRVYFGDILGVEGFGKEAQAKCPNCKSLFTVQRATLRASTLPKT